VAAQPEALPVNKQETAICPVSLRIVMQRAPGRFLEFSAEELVDLGGGAT